MGSLWIISAIKKSHFTTTVAGWIQAFHWFCLPVCSSRFQALTGWIAILFWLKTDFDIFWCVNVKPQVLRTPSFEWWNPTSLLVKSQIWSGEISSETWKLKTDINKSHGFLDCACIGTGRVCAAGSVNSVAKVWLAWQWMIDSPRDAGKNFHL